MFELERRRPYHLGRSPLAQVLVLASFPLVAHFQELAGVAAIQDSLQTLFPYMERQQVQQVAVTLGPVGAVPPAATEATVFWRFTGDNEWALVVSPGSAALMTGGKDYRGSEDFAERFASVLQALEATQRIRRCDRLGLRYVNVVESPLGDERAWSRWLKPELIGWIGHRVLGAETRLQVSLTQSQLSAKAVAQFAGFPGDVHARINHGVLPPGTEIPLDIGFARRLDQESYILDLDLFVQTPQPFDRAALMDQFKALHAQIDAFFRWSLTEQGEEHFGLEER